MRRSLLAVTLFASTAAFATGERITVTGAAAPLKETLCISMNCVASGGREFNVTGRSVKGGVELTVTNASGQTRLTLVAPLNEWNQNLVDRPGARHLAGGAGHREGAGRRSADCQARRGQPQAQAEARRLPREPLSD